MRRKKGGMAYGPINELGSSFGATKVRKRFIRLSNPIVVEARAGANRGSFWPARGLRVSVWGRCRRWHRGSEYKSGNVHQNERSGTEIDG